MKQIKTLMVAALTLLMGVTMTSCLNSEGGETLYDGYFLAKVVSGSALGGTSFQDAGGNTFNASYESVMQVQANGLNLSELEMAFIYFKWAVDESGNVLTPPNEEATTPQTYEIDLVAVQEVSIEDAERMETMADFESSKYETASLSLTNLTGLVGNSVKFDFYGDDETLYMYVQWLLTNGTEEFKKHKIRLVYVNEEITSDSKELKFYLCHDKGDDDGLNAVYGNWYCFRVQNALATFRSITGKDPATIKLSLYEDSGTTGVLPSSRTDYTLNNN